MNNLSLRVRHLVACCIVAVAVSNVALAAAEPSINDSRVCAPDGIALGGYDVVSYFGDSGPVLGGEAFVSVQGDLTYRFASKENLEAFTADPKRYLPTYLGWCSATLSMGRLTCPDFTNYKIENGSLLLFERIGFSNGLAMWNLDPAASRRNADEHFARLNKAVSATP